MMAAPRAFGVEDARSLQALLSAPERPGDTMDYFEGAGFLFAVCCNPDMVMPSEWLPEVLGKEGGVFADLDEVNRALELVMGLYNHLNTAVVERRPALPPLCEVQSDPLANLEADAPLSRWSRGFANAYEWLLESWPEHLPKDLDEDLGACLVVLTFHAKRDMAEDYWKDTKGKSGTLAEMAVAMQGTIPDALREYARLVAQSTRPSSTYVQGLADAAAGARENRKDACAENLFS